MEWKESILVLILKGKGDTLACSNNRGIKLLPHSFNVCERIIYRQTVERKSKDPQRPVWFYAGEKHYASNF